MNTVQTYNFYKKSALSLDSEKEIKKFTFLKEILGRINQDSTLTIKKYNNFDSSILNFKPESIKGIIHQNETKWRGVSNELVFTESFNDKFQKLINTNDSTISIFELLEKNKALYNTKTLIIVSNNIWYDSDNNIVKESTLISIYDLPIKELASLVDESLRYKKIEIDLCDMIGIENGLNGNNIFKVERYEFISKFLFNIFIKKLKNIIKNEKSDSIFINLSEIFISIYINDNNFIIQIKGVEIMSEITFYGSFSDNIKFNFRELYGSLDEINLMLDYLIQIWNNSSHKFS